MITQKRLHDLFVYDDGNLIRNGKIAGSINKRGYRCICVDNKIYKTHRLVFLYHHGFLPEQIDHADKNPKNNRIENLRPASNGQNCMNRGLMKNNTSGFKGVFFDKETDKWRVAIRFNNKLHSFGRFKDLELAELVAIEARNKFHKEFANHGAK
jgi:hypothetical protein